jgi:acyl-CoA thioesterase
MAAIALRAAAGEAAIKRPASFYCHFIRPARFDAIDARVTVIQQGRRAESIRVSLIQDGKPVVEGLLRTALPSEGLVHRAAVAPSVPAPEALPALDEFLPTSFPFWNNIEARIVLPERLRADRGPLPPHFTEWYRFRPLSTFDDPVVDAARSLVLIDTLGWPAAWLQHPQSKFRGPNLDVVAFFHASARHSEWLLAEHVSPIGGEGLIGAQARIFDREGGLVASGGAQLICVPAPSDS